MDFGPRQWFFLFLGVAVAWVGSYLWRKYKRQEDKSTEAEQSAKPQTAPAPTPHADNSVRFQDALESLIGLNQAVRLDTRLSEAQVAGIESVIDAGIEALPKAKEKYPTHELSWEICRMLSHWLPEQVRRYVALSETARAEKGDELASSLASMRLELARLMGIINTGAEMEFGAALATIRLKYGKI